jgi:hypothetical protein
MANEINKVTKVSCFVPNINTHPTVVKEKYLPGEEPVDKLVTADMAEINDWLDNGWVRLPVKFNSWRQNLEDNLTRPEGNQR